MNAFPRFASLHGVVARSAATTPAIPQALEFDSQRKLDLPRGSLSRCDLPGPPVRPLRKRTETACTTLQSTGYIAPEYPGGWRAEIWMVDDVEEFGAELQHASFSQKSQLRILHQRKVPIPVWRPGYDITPRRA